MKALRLTGYLLIGRETAGNSKKALVGYTPGTRCAPVGACFVRVRVANRPFQSRPM